MENQVPNLQPQFQKGAYALVTAKPPVASAPTSNPSNPVTTAQTPVAPKTGSVGPVNGQPAQDITYGGNTNPVVKTDTTTQNTTSTTNTTSGDQTLKDAQARIDRAEADFQETSSRVQKTITDIQNGSVPLSAGEQAQIAGLQQSFGALIEQQKLANKGAEGLGNIRGYQTGAAEYDPSFQAKTIGSIITGGINKITELNIKMASAVAQLTQSFKTNDIAAVKDSFALYEDAYNKRVASIDKTVKDSQKAIKDAQDEQERAEKEHYERVEKPINDLIMDAKKRGAPPEVINAIRNSNTYAEAVDATGGYLNEGSKPISVGGYIYRQDQTGNWVNMGKTAVKTTAPATKVVSGKITADDVQSIRDLFQNGTPNKQFGGRGEDGYVNTGLYNSLFSDWLSEGGTAEAFVKEFPIKTNVNPQDYKYLPATIRPSSGTTKTTVRDL